MRIIYLLYLISILWRFEKKDMTENEISYLVIEESISIHKRLGAGLLERVYQEALFHALKKRGLYVTKEIMVPVVIDDIQIDCAYRIDILVENKVVIEIKSVDSLNDLHLAQTLTYLRLGGFRLGLLLNFNSVVLRSGIKRLVNNL
jgi:GxxExxY protein